MYQTVRGVEFECIFNMCKNYCGTVPVGIIYEGIPFFQVGNDVNNVYYLGFKDGKYYKLEAVFTLNGANVHYHIEIVEKGMWGYIGMGKFKVN